MDFVKGPCGYPAGYVGIVGDCGFKGLRPHRYYRETMWILDLPVRAAGLGC